MGNNNWSKKSSYSIAQLRIKAQQIYGIENASFVKKDNFTATVNAAVVDNLNWLDNGGAGDFKEPSEISDQPLCIWDDSVIVFVKDLNEESKLKTMSPTELAE